MKSRHFYYGELDVYYPQFDKIVETVKSKLVSIEHLTDNQKEMINKKLEDAIKFIDSVKADKAAKQLHEDPAFNCDQIIGTMNSLKYDSENIFNLPPPKPKSPEKPAEGDKPAEGQPDDTMKDAEGPKTDDVKDPANANPDVEM